MTLLGLDLTVRRPEIDDAVAAWLTDISQPRFFVVFGAPGSGKTVWAQLLAKLERPNDLTQSTPIHTPVSAYHFCKPGDLPSISPLIFLEGVFPTRAQPSRL